MYGVGSRMLQGLALLSGTSSPDRLSPRVPWSVKSESDWIHGDYLIYVVDDLS